MTAVVTGLLLLGAVSAQLAARKFTLESTLRYYQRNADKPEARRSHPVAALGGYQSEEVTRILLEEVARAQTAEFRRTAVRALGRTLRRGALPVKKARKAVGACVAKGGTSIHDALERAFADPGLDTI